MTLAPTLPTRKADTCIMRKLIAFVILTLALALPVGVFADQQVNETITVTKTASLTGPATATYTLGAGRVWTANYTLNVTTSYCSGVSGKLGGNGSGSNLIDNSKRTLVFTASAPMDTTGWGGVVLGSPSVSPFMSVPAASDVSAGTIAVVSSITGLPYQASAWTGFINYTITCS